MHNDVRNTSTTNQASDHRTSRRIPVLGRLSRHTAVLTTGLVAGVLLGGGGYAIAASHTTTIHGCVNDKTHALTVQKRCARGTKTLTWDQTGPRGLQGKTGATGPQGPAGGADAVVDTAEVANTGQLVNGTGVTASRSTGTGSYQVTATGCTRQTAAPQVSVLDGLGGALVSSTVAPDASGSVSQPVFDVHVWETASVAYSGGTPTWTTVTNPVPYDASFYITVTC